MTLACEKPDFNALEQRLLDLGAASIMLADARDEPIFEPLPGQMPLWHHLLVTAMFESAIASEAVCTALQQEGWSAQHMAVESLPDRQWERAWMDDYHAMQFGEGIWVIPSHEQVVDRNAVNLFLDPGLAFGSGTHPTTAMCLEWLDSHRPAGLKVIDYGCGSGILAIASWLCGAAEVDAVDIDPQALQATRANLLRNQLDPGHSGLCLPHQLAAKQVDLLLANILSGPLCELRDEFLAHLRPGGRLLLSGMLQSQLDDIRRYYAGLIEFDYEQHQGDWACLAGYRSDS